MTVSVERGEHVLTAVMDDGKPAAVLLPEHRFYPAEGQDMNDTAIRTNGWRDLYLALGDDRGGGRFTLRAYVSPLAPLIWLGGLVMALGTACIYLAAVLVVRPLLKWRIERAGQPRAAYAAVGRP